MKLIAERNSSSIFIKSYQVEDNKEKLTQQLRFVNLQL